MEELDKKLLHVIIKERKSRKISRTILAEKIRFPLPTVNDIESGRTNRISANFLLLACKFLGIDITRTIDNNSSDIVIKQADLNSIKRDLEEINGKLNKFKEIFLNTSDDLEKKKGDEDNP